MNQKKKKENLDFFSLGKIPVYFLCSIEKKLTCDQNSGKNDVTQVTA